MILTKNQSQSPFLVLEKFRVWLNEKIVSKSVYEEIVSDLLAPYLNLLQQQHSNGQHGLSDKGKKHEKEKKAEKKKGAHGEKSEKDTHHKAASRIDVLPAADEQQRQLIENTKYQKQSIQKVRSQIGRSEVQYSAATEYPDLRSIRVGFKVEVHYEKNSALKCFSVKKLVEVTLPGKVSSGKILGIRLSEKFSSICKGRVSPRSSRF